MANFELDQAVTRYNIAAKRLNDSVLNASSAALSQRRNIEQEYALASRELMRNGYLMKLKRKYTHH